MSLASSGRMVQASASNRVFAVLIGLLLGGCGSNDPGRGSGTGGGGRGGGGGSGTGGGGGGGGAVGGSTGGGGMAGGPCTSTSCGLEEFCATCGDAVGKCVYRPQDCITQPGAAVCGCDGKLYMTDCDASLSGMFVTNIDHCPAPPGTFRCGTTFCTHGSQYCQTWYWNKDLTNLGRYVARYACVDLPTGCGTTPTCACVASAGCGECAVSADGDLTAGCLVSP